MPRWCYVALFNEETFGFLLDSTQVGNYHVRRCYTFNLIFHYRIPGGLNSDTIAQKKTSIADIFSSVFPNLKSLLLECNEVNITIENIVASPPGVNSVFFRIPVVLTASDSVADSGVSSTLISCLDKLREYKALLDQQIPTINQGGSTYSEYNSSTMTDKKSCCGGNIPPPCCAAGSVKVSSTKCGKQRRNLFRLFMSCDLLLSATAVKPQSHIQLWSLTKLWGRLLVCRSFSFFSRSWANVEQVFVRETILLFVKNIRELKQRQRWRYREREKAIGLISKTTTLHVLHAFSFVHFLAILARLRRETA